MVTKSVCINVLSHLLLLVVLCVGLSSVAYAAESGASGLGQNNQGTGGQDTNQSETGGLGQNHVPPFSSSSALANPIPGIASITDFFLAILDILLVFAIPFVVFFIIYAGFMYVTARGDIGKIKTAHNALLYAIIGGLLILGARLILAVISGTVNEFISMGNLWLG